MNEMNAKTVTVYKPCLVCRGTGLTPWMPETPYSVDGIARMVTAHTVQACDVCGGTGKGAIESIREELPYGS